MSLTLLVGTAGYAYAAWNGEFYPPGTPAGEQLRHYARHFTAVEINSTFYRVPTAEQLEKMATKVGPNFRFTVKVPRTATHEADLRDLPAFRDSLAPLVSRRQLGGLLVQLPESFRNNAGNRVWLIRLRDLLSPHRLAVEFRHRSWADPELRDWPARHGYAAVNVGVPDLPQLYPGGMRTLGERVYCRLHSENPAGWYAGHAERYAYEYPDAALRVWAKGLGEAADGGATEAFVFFNNCVGTQAIENARRLVELVRGDLRIRVAEPPVAPPPTGRAPSLFDEPAPGAGA